MEPLPIRLTSMKRKNFDAPWSLEFVPALKLNSTPLYMMWKMPQPSLAIQYPGALKPCLCMENETRTLANA